MGNGKWEMGNGIGSARSGGGVRFYLWVRAGGLALVTACSHRNVVSSGTAITGVAVVDVKSGSILADRTVVFDSGRITMVVPAAEIGLGSQVTRIAGEGKYLIPGLWDMHVHLSPMLEGPAILPLFTAYGVTGVRDLGSKDSI